MTREHNERAWTVWHIEALRRKKQLPRFNTLLAKPSRSAKRKQSWQEQMLIMDRWARVMRRVMAQTGK